MMRMVKFIVKKVRDGCRLGELVVSDEKDVLGTAQTPMCMLYTRGGSVPYLTKDMLVQISHLPAVVHMPLNLLVEHEKVLTLYNKGLASFTAMEMLVFTSMQDVAESVPSGYNSNAGVSVWGRGGKHLLSVEDWMRLIAACCPDWYESLCDSDTQRDSSRKRVRRAVDRTLTYLDACIDMQTRLPTLSGSSIIGVVEGGYYVDERLRSAIETAKRPVAGFSIQGFHSCGPAVEYLHVSEIEDLLLSTLSSLPVDKPRLLPGAWSPSSVIHAVRLGVDVFDSSYPYIVTSRGSALVFQCSVQPDRVNSHSDNIYEISLKDKCYADDCRPILNDCSCYTCQTHTRAYVHHLLNTSELLATVLLMTHNCHHYFAFFQTIRDAIMSDCHSLSSLEHQLQLCDQQLQSRDQKQPISNDQQSCDKQPQSVSRQQLQSRDQQRRPISDDQQSLCHISDNCHF